MTVSVYLPSIKELNCVSGPEKVSVTTVPEGLVTLPAAVCTPPAVPVRVRTNAAAGSPAKNTGRSKVMVSDRTTDRCGEPSLTVTLMPMVELQ